MRSLVEAQAVEKSFFPAAGELRILRGVDLTLAQGELVGIVGASGAGKSTFLHILGALDRPTAGNVLYEGTDVFGMDAAGLAEFRNKTVGFVFQFHHLLPEFTAIENVMMPGLIAGAGRSGLRDRAALILEELGLGGRMDHRPGELSGGEQQRVAVARALVMSPKVVLADEPTGNLDAATGEELFRLILRLNKERGIAFVIVTHNESLSRRCHRVLKMEDGRLTG